VQGALELAGYQTFLYPSVPLFFETFVLDGSGDADGLLPWGAIPEFLCGATVTAQAGVLDASAPGGAVWTAGLSVTYGSAQGIVFPEPQRSIMQRPWDIEFADFNHDGLSDLAYTDNYQNVGLSLARGIGDFQDPTLHGSFTITRGILAADLNADGSPDLAAADRGADEVAILVNDGAGAFTVAAAANTSVNAGPSDVVALDLDLDGDLDLVTADAGAHTISILLNDGTATFANAVSVGAGMGPRRLATADLDLDGHGDVATANGISGTASIFLGAGDGTLSLHASPAVGPSPWAIGIADVDADGLPDLAALNKSSSEVTVLLGTGGAQFAGGFAFPTGTEPSGLALGDATGDGLIDIVTSNEVSDDVTVLAGGGDGSFVTAETIPSGNGPWTVVLEDLTLDGRLDIAIAAYQLGGALAQIRIHLGQPDGTFSANLHLATGTEPNAVAVADMDNNGALDLVVVGDDFLAVHWNQGGGAFAAPTILVPASGDFYEVFISDLNGDGWQDVVTAWPSDVAVLLGTGGGNFGPADTMSFPAGMFALRDVTGDGVEDIVGSSGNLARVMPGNGDGTFGSWFNAVNMGMGEDLIALADLDGDGNEDFVTLNFGFQFKVATGLGNGTWTAPVILPFGLDTNGPFAVADCDEDGKLDLVFGLGHSEIHFLPGNGDGTFTGSTSALLPYPVYSLAFEDLQGDGALDVISNVPGGILSTVRGLGAGAYSSPRSFAVGSQGITDLAFGDLNGDGALDAVAVSDTDEVVVLFNRL